MTRQTKKGIKKEIHSIGNRGNNNSTYFSLVILSRRSKCITTYYFPGRQMQEAHLILKSRNWLHIPGNQKSEISQKTSLGIRIQLIFPCSSCPTKYISIRMSHWRHMMVDGTEFWITCKQLKLLRNDSHWQLIQNSVPSTIMLHQCDIWIAQTSG